jgi:probable HAF family extracellular repeat protein
LEARCLLSNSYTITDLGTLGGPTSSAAAINNAGEVVGSADTHNYYWEIYVDSGVRTKDKVYQEDPFLWTPSTPNGTSGSLTDLGNFGGWNNGASGINGLGQVVGSSDLSTGASHAFLWGPSTANGASGTLIDLGTLGGTNSSARGINRSGQIVGGSDTSSGASLAFLWGPTAPNGTSGTMADLGTITGALPGIAAGINDSGQIAGTSGLAAFLYSGGTMIDLGHLGGSSVQEDSEAYGINNFGEVVGISYTGSATHAFLWAPPTANGTSGTLIDLGSLIGASGNSEAYGINSAGQVVGASYTGSATHAFLWAPSTANGASGTMIDLNTLIGSSAISLEAATGINDQGQIVGAGVLKSNGSRHAFLLTPTSTTTALAQPASSTPTASTAGPTVAPGGDPSLAPVLARPTSGSTNFGPTTVPVALPVPQPPAAAAAPGPAPLLAQAPLFVPPLTSNLPPAGADTGSPHPAETSAAAADRALASLDAELSWAPVAEDLALLWPGAVPTA